MVFRVFVAIGIDLVISDLEQQNQKWGDNTEEVQSLTF
jgi:hypothetical protein